MKSELFLGNSGDEKTAYKYQKLTKISTGMNAHQPTAIAFVAYQAVVTDYVTCLEGKHIMAK